ncbi:MAG TPA: hypothetical protein VGE27_01540 [Gemmatimonas sp.]|uniref:hypothetical protein n=1 Tax=Gemmatimonas sp. TaxID=1962908 RepID=UPI002EDA3115
MPWNPQSQEWTSNRAILLVHGIGNAAPGDYKELLDRVKAALGPAAHDTVIYQLWYDQINDWVKNKLQVGSLLQQAVDTLSTSINDPEIGETMAEVIGDVLWPVLVAEARAAVRDAFLAQVKRMLLDAEASNIDPLDRKISIICHSLGCFHTYEALHHAAVMGTHALRPGSEGVVFENVIFMASPVQLIRTVADRMGPLVPNRRWLYSVKGDALSIPNEPLMLGGVTNSVNRWISITGSLDPVGGHFFRRRADWGYMNVNGQFAALVDDQQLLGIDSPAALLDTFLASRRPDAPPLYGMSNPHSWEGYVDRHAEKLREWLT